MIDKTLCEIGEDLDRAVGRKPSCSECSRLRRRIANLEAEAGRLRISLMEEKRGRMADQQRRAQRGM